MRGRLQEPIQDEVASGRLRPPSDRAAGDRASATRSDGRSRGGADGRAEAMIVRAAMDLQRTAGNRSVATLLAGARARPGGHPLAAIDVAGRHAAPVTPAPSRSPAVAVQREARPEPCVDCPEAAQRLASTDPEATTDADGPA